MTLCGRQGEEIGVEGGAFLYPKKKEIKRTGGLEARRTSDQNIIYTSNWATFIGELLCGCSCQLVD